jgi:hypothetical protein
MSDSTSTNQSEFCRACGAGVGKFRLKGEGTCPICDPVGCGVIMYDGDGRTTRDPRKAVGVWMREYITIDQLKERYPEVAEKIEFRIKYLTD